MEIQHYYPNYTPLKKVVEDELEHNDIIYDEFGRCKRKIIIKRLSYYIDICDSVLIDGELMTNLTVPLQLELFWKLSKHKLKRVRTKR
jgi:hypothetical protein